MLQWNGAGSFQWEHQRTWDIPASGAQMVLAEGALCLPGGFRSLSFFFRRISQSGPPVDLEIWTAPVFFQPLDDDFSANPENFLRQVTIEPSNALQLSDLDTPAQRVYGGRIKDDQPVGTLLFWRMNNPDTTTAAKIVGDIYVVSNHIGVATGSHIGRTVDAGGRPPTRKVMRAP